MLVNFDKNRERDDYSFANVNLLGSRCNIDCFFCLGKDIEGELRGKNQLQTNFLDWRNFSVFLETCSTHGIEKIYLTAQNTDVLMYRYLEELINFLKLKGFKVGLRTNGYLALDMLEIINMCDLSVGYSIHSLNPVTNRAIINKESIPKWDKIIPGTKNPRVQVVVNRYNYLEFFEILKYLDRFKNLRYIQARRVSTDTRQDLLSHDAASYERIYTEVNRIFPVNRKFWHDVEEYIIYTIPVTFWRTVKTSVNSINYFTDGTISDSYFIVEGYLKHYRKGFENG